MSVDTGGDVLCGDRWVVALMVDVLQCSVRLRAWLVGVLSEVKCGV